MARSSGPAGQTGGSAQHRRQHDGRHQDPRLPEGQQAAPTATQHGQPQWPPPAQQGYAQQGYPGDYAQGYHFPQASDAEAAYAQAVAAQRGSQPAAQHSAQASSARHESGDGFVPQFERYPPQHLPPAVQAAKASRQGQIGDGLPQPSLPQGRTSPVSQWPHQDPRGYDFGQYAPAGSGHGAQAHASAADAPLQRDAHGQGWAAQPRGGYGDTAPNYDAHGYGNTQPVPHQPQYANQETGEYEEEEGDYADEPRRGKRAFVIVAALIGAIGIGGGLAYAYKTFGGAGKAPLVKAPMDASKTKPVNPGGKDFAHTDKKLLNRLGEDGGQRIAAAVPGPSNDASDATQDDPSGARRVRTIAIAPNSAMPPPAAPPAAAGPAQVVPVKPAPMMAVPGMSIENLAPPTAARPTPQSGASVQAVAPSASAPAAQPKPQPKTVVAVVAPAAGQANQVQETAPVETSSAPGKKAAPVKQQVPKTDTAAAAPPAAAAPSGITGYVAVIASQRSRMDALKAFADLQQKYGDVLGGKPSEVKEANLGDKGVWYRAVIGPPGSRDAAASVCSQLKTAGFGGCWVSAY